MSGWRNAKFEWQDHFLAKSGYKQGAVLAVAWWLSNRWNGDTQLVVAPVEKIVAETPYAKRAVLDALTTLRNDGWIAQHRSGRNVGTRAGASTYRLTIPNQVHSGADHVHSGAQPSAAECTLVDPVVDHSVDQESLIAREACSATTFSGIKPGSESEPEVQVDPRCPWCIPEENICAVDGVGHDRIGAASE